MPDLLCGTVSFLFTDVEGSTRLLHELGAEGYAVALAEHRRLLREAFARHGGVEVDAQGDAFFVAFPTAPGALAAAAEAQRALAAGPIRVRMGLHTGTPLLAEEGYVGVDVHRAARIAAAGHGGQVLVSAATRSLVDASPLRDLGEHRLKDLAAPERLWQLGEQEFPPLKTLYRTNLPVPATPFLGREQELHEVVALLHREDVRLLTLTGPGGTGKTRLALQAAAEAVEQFPDGLTWVALSPLRDPALLLAAVAQALEVKEEPGRPLTDTLVAQLSRGRQLLLLDNAEHLLPQAADDVARLREASAVTLLVTSRERLQLQGEQVWAVPPLDEEDGVTLFTARSRALDASFTASPVVRELCERLDNLPLALELAAARTPLFTPEQLLERLSQRLDLLRAGRDADPRQQTLRATIAWSHDLLDEDEQRLFRRLAMFVGGCTYEAAETVCEADPDTLQSLLDQSLLRRRDGELGPRYWMLETIREYAEEQLEALEEAENLRRLHLEYLLQLAERTKVELKQREWLRRIEAERDNIRGALAWSLSAGDPLQGLQLAITLGEFWVVCDHVEGFHWISEALDRAEGAPLALRANALRWAGSTLFFTGDYVRAVEFGKESLALFRQLGDTRAIAAILDRVAGAQLNLGQLDEGRAAAEESLALYEELGDREGALYPLSKLGWLEWQSGNRERGLELTEESLARAREFGNPRREAVQVTQLAEMALERGDPERAEHLCRDSLALSLEIGHRPMVVYCVALLAGVAARRGDRERAGRLWGGVDALERAGDPRLVGAFSVQLAEEAASLDTAVEAGREMDAVEVVAYALES